MRNLLSRHPFTYDDQNRVIEAYNVNSGGNDYVYDSLGRITQYEGVGQTNNTTFPAFARKNSGYTYDANGSAKTRAGRTLTWDVQNRLKEVKNGSVTEESYLYDPDGQRVKKTAGSSNLYYPFTHYGIAGSTVTKYYFFAVQRIAMNKGGTLYYLHSDHLGSTVLTTQGTTTSSNVSPIEKGAAFHLRAPFSILDYLLLTQRVPAAPLQTLPTSPRRALG